MLYTPQYQNNWSRVLEFIRKNWDNYVGLNPNLPYPFSYALEPKIQFYWDTYFTNIGLLMHDRPEQARRNVDNLLFETEKYGFIPNANTDWGDNRSQPPYAAIAVHELMHKKENHQKDWLKAAYFTLKKEYHFWTDPSADALEPHGTSMPGLQRYFHHANTKVLADLFAHAADRCHFDRNLPETEKFLEASHLAAEAASGMDFTPRFENRCADFLALDLNVNLYRYELIFAEIVQELELPAEPDWNQIAWERKARLQDIFWNADRGLFLDYDCMNRRHSRCASAMTFTPLVAGLAHPEQAAQVQQNLCLFETEHGIAACELYSDSRNYQWDHGAIWAPLQILAMQGLQQYGYTDDAKRIAAKYLDLVTRHYLNPEPATGSRNQKTIHREPGFIYEKYTTEGLINDREYAAFPMLGWSAAAFVVAYSVWEK